MHTYFSGRWVGGGVWASRASLADPQNPGWGKCGEGGGCAPSKISNCFAPEISGWTHLQTSWCGTEHVNTEQKTSNYQTESGLLPKPDHDLGNVIATPAQESCRPTVITHPWRIGPQARTNVPHLTPAQCPCPVTPNRPPPQGTGKYITTIACLPFMCTYIVHLYSDRTFRLSGVCTYLVCTCLKSVQYEIFSMCPFFFFLP